MSDFSFKAGLAIPAACALSLALAGCSSSGSSDSPDSQRSASPTQNMATDASDILFGAGQTLALAGLAVSMEDTPLPDGVTDGTGNVLRETGLGLTGSATALRDGLGQLEQNDNALGTTLSGIPVIVSGTGKAVAGGSVAVPGLAELPVFMQIEETSGALTMLGSTLADAGMEISRTADGFAVELRDPNSPAGGVTTQLTGVIRPVIFQAEGGLQQAGDALVIGPVASDLLNQTGSAIVVAGQDLAMQDITFLGVSRSVQGTGRLVQSAGGLLTAGGEGGGLGSGGLPTDAILAPLTGDGGLPTDALLGGLTGGGLPTDALLGGLTGDGGLPTDALLGGLTGDGGLPTDSLLDGLTGGEDDGSNPLTGLLSGLTGTLSQ